MKIYTINSGVFALGRRCVKRLPSSILNGIRILSVIPVLVAANAGAQVTYDLGASGTWTSATTWNPSTGTPTSVDSIAIQTISAPITVTMDGTAATVYTVSSFLYNQDNAVTFSSLASSGAKTLAVTGDFVKNGSGTLAFVSTTSSQLSLNIGGNLVVSSGTLKLGGPVSSNLLSGITVGGSTTIANGATVMAMFSSGSSQKYGVTTINGALQLGGAYAAPGAMAVTFSGLSGSGSVSVPIDYTGTTSKTTTIYLSPAAGSVHTYSGSISESALQQIGLTSSGAGVQVLAGATNYTGKTVVIGGGVLVFAGTSSISSANVVIGSNVLAQGTGILGLGNGDFIRDIGTGAGQVQIMGVNGGGGGGFAAYGADRLVTFNSNATIAWGSTGFFSGGAGTLYLSDASADHKVTITNAIDLNNTASVAARAVVVGNGSGAIDAEFSGILSSSSASVSLTKSGAGTLLLSNTNSYTGGLKVNGGVVIIGAADALSSGNLQLTGGVLGLGVGDFTRSIGTSTGMVQLTDGGGFAAFNADRIVNLGGSGASLKWGTTSFFSAGGKFVLNDVNSAYKLTLQNAMDLNGAARTVVVNGTASKAAAITGVISSSVANAGSLVKEGTGTLELTANNTYYSGTTVSAGELLVNNNGVGSGTGTGTVSVAVGASLGGTGRISGATSIAGSIEGGDGGVGTLTLNNGLAMADGAILKLSVGGTTAAPTSTLINLTAGTLDLTGTQTLSLISLSPYGVVDPYGMTFVLVDSATEITNVGNWVIDYGTTGWEGGTISINSLDNTQLIITGLVVPEPGTCLLIGVGMIAMGWARFRRNAC